MSSLRNHSLRFLPRLTGQVSEQNVAAKPHFSGFLPQNARHATFSSLFGNHSRDKRPQQPSEYKPEESAATRVLPQIANSSTQQCARY